MRKIIQIEAVCREHCIPDLIALCDDGTLWKAQIMSGYETKWQSFAAPVPQPVVPKLDLDAINARQLPKCAYCGCEKSAHHVDCVVLKKSLPDFELPSSKVPSAKEKIVRELLTEDIAFLKVFPGVVDDGLPALEAFIAQKGMEVIRPSGLWFAGVDHGRKNP